MGYVLTGLLVCRSSACPVFVLHLRCENSEVEQVYSSLARASFHASLYPVN